MPYDPARRFGIVWLAIVLFAAPAQAEGRRVALVIGNNAYTAEAALENAVRDAELVAGALRRVGFEVTTYHDLDNRALRTALRRFAGVADGAEVAALYFAGHGIAVDGRNWLLPVDARLADVRDLDDEAVPDTRLTAAVEGARGLQLVVLDACRNNPFAPRMAGRAGGRQVQGRGLDRIPDQDLPPNRLIAFSARDGQVAQDGPGGGDGPYAVALAQRLVQPGVEIGLLLRRVRDDVAALTRATQVPWTYSNLGGQELYLADSVVPPLPGGYPVAVGQSFHDCTDGTCPEMVVIPAGHFQMGSPESEPGRYDDEGPRHMVTVSAPLAVGKYDVTFAEWDACVAAGGCSQRPGDEGWGRGGHPVINVSWDDAQSYVRWLSGRTGRGYRLLTEAEWEYAARAGRTTAYFTGDTIGASQANFNANLGHTSPVGQYPANAWGLYDMAGNVWQWVADCYRDSYAGTPSDASTVVMENNCPARVLRGGSWLNSPRGLRAANRVGDAPRNRGSGTGFRLARTPAP